MSTDGASIPKTRHPITRVPLPKPPHKTEIRSRSGKRFRLKPHSEVIPNQIPGFFFLIIGPTAVGKKVAVNGVMAAMPSMEPSVSVTTRAPRNSATVQEKHGEDYHFVTDDEFLDLIGENHFLEHKVVHGKRYGTPFEPLYLTLSAGGDMLADVDIDGAKSITENAHLLPGGIASVVTIFLLPPSMEELEVRLRKSGRDLPEAEMELRLSRAQREIEVAKVGNFDHLVISHTGKQKELIAEICGIIEAKIKSVQSEKKVYAV